jgi:hypothetical protein
MRWRILWSGSAYGYAASGLVLVMPFADPWIGGVGTRQRNVLDRLGHRA